MAIKLRLTTFFSNHLKYSIFLRPTVIASEAKQSRMISNKTSIWIASSQAPRNDISKNLFKKFLFATAFFLSLIAGNSFAFANNNNIFQQQDSSQEQAWQKFGDYGRFAIPGAAVLFTVYHNDFKGIQQFALSMLAVQAATEGLKSIVKETRPRGGSDKSFPSGHTSAAFSAAAFIHKRYGWKVSVPAYIGATLVGVSRVETNAHFAHDVVAGAALGIGLTWLITTPFENKNIMLMPVVRKNFAGISLNAQLD